MPEGSDRSRGSGDPFEELDDFFAPIEGVEWPEDQGQRASGAAAPEPPGTSGEVPPGPSEDASGDPSRSGRAQHRAGDADADATREMSRDEWRRLRDVLGDDAQSVEFPLHESTPSVEFEDAAGFDLDRGFVRVPDEPVRATASGGSGPGSGSSASGGVGRDQEPAEATDGSGTGGSGGQTEPPRRERVRSARSPGAEDLSGGEDLTAAWPEPEVDDEPGELTLEDLKKAPPEYRDLPGPRDAETTPPGSAARPAPPSRPAPIQPRETHVQVFGGTPDVPPSLAEVEAMAESLAKEFRSAPEEGEAEPGSAPSAGRSAVAGAVAAAGGVAVGREPPSFDDDLVGQFEPPEPPEPPAPRSAPRTIKVGAPEDLTGPSWEDPSSRTVTRDQAPAPRRGEDRDLPTAVITAAILIAAALLAIAFKPIAFAIVAAVVIVIAQAEFYAATQRQGYHPATLLGLVGGAMVVAGAYYQGEAGILLMIVLSLVATFLWYMATPARARNDVIANAGVTMFGLLYVPVTGSFFVVMLVETKSRGLILAVLALTFLYDVAAFFIGRYWGRRPLAPTISPKKSWEGLFGATVVTVLVASVLPRSLEPLTSELKLVGLGLVIVIFAPLGDLVESLLKRDLAIKDMGSILPGHGGMLDRIDSALLVGPAVYYFLRVIA